MSQDFISILSRCYKETLHHFPDRKGLTKDDLLQAVADFVGRVNGEFSLCVFWQTSPVGFEVGVDSPLTPSGFTGGRSSLPEGVKRFYQTMDDYAEHWAGLGFTGNEDFSRTSGILFSFLTAMDGLGGFDGRVIVLNETGEPLNSEIMLHECVPA